MSEYLFDAAHAPAPEEARAIKRPRRRAQCIGETEVGRVYTIRIVVTGRGEQAMFCRAIDADGRESEPRHLPNDWPVQEEG